MRDENDVLTYEMLIKAREMIERPWPAPPETIDSPNLKCVFCGGRPIIGSFYCAVGAKICPDCWEKAGWGNARA